MAIARRLDEWAPRVRSILRFVSGLALLHHGTMKLLQFPPSDMFPAGKPLPPIMIAAGGIELVCGVLLVLGLFTRPAAFVASGFAAVAYFMAHAPQGFYPALNGGEAALLYSFIFLYLTFAGGGAWSIDAWFDRRRPLAVS
jgi:putative oxidoreductase